MTFIEVKESVNSVVKKMKNMFLENKEDKQMAKINSSNGIIVHADFSEAAEKESEEIVAGDLEKSIRGEDGIIKDKAVVQKKKKPQIKNGYYLHFSKIIKSTEQASLFLFSSLDRPSLTKDLSEITIEGLNGVLTVTDLNDINLQIWIPKKSFDYINEDKKTITVDKNFYEKQTKIKIFESSNKVLVPISDIIERLWLIKNPDPNKGSRVYKEISGNTPSPYEEAYENGADDCGEESMDKN